MTQQNSPALHVVLGAGQIGSRLTQLLLQRGYRVRTVRRSATRGGNDARLEASQGNLADLAFAEGACAGAAVVYDCTNPAYHRWNEELLPLARGALHGATRAGARLVALDCLYMYGRPEQPINEVTPFAPRSRKGELRARLHHLRMEAHQRGDLPVAIGRASDFFGANLPWSYLGGERFWGAVSKDRKVMLPIDPDTLHAYSYAEDVAVALRMLGERPQAPGTAWMLPTPTALTSRELAERLGQEVGREVRLGRLPRAVLVGAGLFSPLLREVAEMTYQWDGPFLLDDGRFRETFGMQPTPWAEALRATAQWATSAYPALSATAPSARLAPSK